MFIAFLLSPHSREHELTFDRVARAVVAECGLAIRDIARNAELDPQSTAAQDAWRVFTELTEYRLFEDLRRGWRVVQPNLENVGLLRIGYRGLGALCANDIRWSFHPSLARMTAADREILVHAVLDQFRRKLAISCRCLQETFAAARCAAEPSNTSMNSGDLTRKSTNFARPTVSSVLDNLPAQPKDSALINAAR